VAVAFLVIATVLLLALGPLVHRVLRGRLVDLGAMRLRAQAKPIIDRRIEHLSGQISVVELAAILAMDLTNRETTASVVDGSGTMIASGAPEEGPEAPILPEEHYQEALAGEPRVTCTVRSGERNVLVVLVPPLAWLPRPPAVVQLATDFTGDERLLRRAVGVLVAGTLCVAWAEFALDVLVGDGLGVLALVGIPVVLLAAMRVAGRGTPARAISHGASAGHEPGARTDFTAVMRRVEAAFLAKQASERRMRRFIADASHELRTPLTSLGGAADVLLRGAKDDPEHAERLARVIRSQADRIGRLVDDLLMLARLDSGLDVEQRNLRFDRLVEEHAEEIALASLERRVELVRADPAIVLGNEDRLRQVLANLTSNALRHTAPGGRIELGAYSAAGQAVAFVRDDGEGIAEEHLPLVFERFWRGDPARGDGGGAGLGLAIVREIVAAHHGEVDVESRAGAGATVTVRLPLVVVAPVEDGAPAAV
jgi:two-component system, OmpR family, sensor kinase